jgi:hypothetical protein
MISLTVVAESDVMPLILLDQRIWSLRSVKLAPSNGGLFS